MDPDIVDAQAQLSRVPERHLAALRAALAGFGNEDIAGLLGIPVSSVPTTLRLAAAKLARAFEPARDGVGGDGLVERGGTTAGGAHGNQ